MRILLMDDDVISLNMFKNALELYGHYCRAYLYPTEGLEDFLSNDYDVIISDYKMPLVNGVDILKSMKKVKPDTKVIIYTGQSDSHIENDAKKYGAYRFFLKPINWSEMLDVLNEIKRPN
jgi:DNA-binding NtrC family response regulator